MQALVSERSTGHYAPHSLPKVCRAHLVATMVSVSMVRGLRLALESVRAAPLHAACATPATSPNGRLSLLTSDSEPNCWTFRPFLLLFFTGVELIATFNCSIRLTKITGIVKKIGRRETYEFPF